MNNKPYCYSIRDNIVIMWNERAYDSLNEFLDDALDIEFTVSSHHDVLGVNISVACGGPFCEIRTRDGSIYSKESAFSEGCIAYLPDDLNEYIHDYFSELFELA